MTTVHRSLHARNISKLPRNLRSVASAAINGSKQDLFHLQRVAYSLPQSEALGLVPVVYATLDPSLFPSPDALDAITDNPLSRPHCIDNAMAAICCLTAVIDIDNPGLSPAALLAIWPRLRTWTEFFWHFDSLLALTAAEEITYHSWISLAFVGYWSHPETHQVVSSTPVVCRSLAAAWVMFMRRCEDDIEEYAHCISSPMSVLATTKTKEHFTELIDGCGGSIESLVDAVKKHISLVTAAPNSRLAGGAIAPVLVIIETLRGIAEDVAQQFLEQGIVASLVSALAIEGASGGTDPRPVGLDLGLNILIGYLELGPKYRWTVQALRAGLLERVIAWGEKLGNVSESEAGKFPQLLLVVLRRLLVFPSGVVKFENALSRVESASRSRAFTRSVLYPSWTALKNTVDVRVQFLEAWKTYRGPSQLACENLQCERVDNKDCFRRCAGCGIAAYCSRTCQRADRVEGHRNECSALLAAHNGASASAFFRSRNKSFMRMLLHAGYLRLRTAIAFKIIDFLVEYPDTAFFVGFDFAPPVIGVPAAVSVVSLSSLPPELQVAYSRKVIQSRGRVMLYAMALVHTHHFVPFLLRTRSSQFFDGLVDVAARHGTLRRKELERIVVDLVVATNEDSENSQLY